MINVIQYLEQNPSLVTLLKEQKASLVGVSSVEQSAILEAFNGEMNTESDIWN
ncbi:competence pheromone ComX [Lysinibacillus sp. OL1_EC]|uniref:competence pheromone ComX n=1 Tax=unclassified Lysinibacillus TaxID=2636778 RepID=UPI00103BA737|nr:MULTISPECIES: competence pheromone ComX [unclassified Lysinibacillus]MCM0624988.1 competence pheromone ComX [Lysinibacillus sp. OL1_EC]MCS5502493.1 competence pheromone ComX [Lysinibacillus sp. A4]TBV87603.1 competence pheromone ComX [Lysinibacillus sp. OL1]UKJ45089.1 competence pheromone ComX [Lysinibacillus sp. ACHW1.5]WGT37712.1 competence pheromone ComX [Lysinibacillus sp. 1 U-2021]